MAFSGFPVEAFEFFDGLAADNSKAYWQANRPVYDAQVRAPMDALLADLADHATFHVFRPYNDVRFAKGRPPYKEQIGALGESEGGAVYYVALSASGIVTGTGYFHMAPDQLERFRVAVDDDVLGPEVARLSAAVEATGCSLGSIGELKTAPRGYPKDHARMDLLRRKGLTAMRSWDVAPWMHTRAVVKRVRDVWASAADLDAWLDANVGPSTLPPAEWRR
ncbi:MAG: hypothetical protein JWM34_2753 [Ilumatobacteraceae bacterium]|nr:hypothetical protein [Ilumatobacteraceae bacterium]